MFRCRLLSSKHPVFEFTFGLEPIVQLTTLLFAAVKIDFVCATPDFLVRRRVPYVKLPHRRLSGRCFRHLYFHFALVSMTYLLLSCRTLCTLSDSVLSNQHHAEPCFAFHHVTVSIGSLFERSCLDHRADILQDAEGKSVLGLNRRAGE
jgi:hypothetical protein